MKSSNATPPVHCQMMIRRPINDVFQAFIDPAITTNFWFTQSTGKLEQGHTVRWTWEMYGVSAEVFTQAIVANELIKIEWGKPKTTVEFKFSALSSDKTYVEIINYGFVEEGQDLINQVKDNMGGFTTVLDGAKAFLEHGINLNLIADKFPAIDNKGK